MYSTTKSPNIHEILKAANKYDDVKNILTDIIKDNEPDYPVKAFINDDGETKWRVKGKSVRNEAAKILTIIDGKNFVKTNNSDETTDDFQNILSYVTTTSDIKLHNYAVALSHRTEPKDNLDDIRSWETLENLIYHLRSNDDWAWEIPNGWHRK